MIHRFVQMTFKPEEVDNFIEVFNHSKDQIRNFPGCKSLQLIKNQEHTHILCTSSIWESAEDLNNYRHSELFERTWAKTKVLFCDKPVAKSYDLVEWIP